jgi:hypothetical protein
MKLSSEQEYWVSKPKQRISSSKLRELLVKQAGKCAFSSVDLVFDRLDRTPVAGGPGCHPLSPAVDHISPGCLTSGVQITCYALNDLKGYLPLDCFEALLQTQAWKDLMERWRTQAKLDPSNREAFRQLLRPKAEQAAASKVCATIQVEPHH